jgi:acetyltransferase-like isoleucine patch superfamily enzyme
VKGDWRTLVRELQTGPVELGADAHIEPGAILGYLTRRPIPVLTLHIGPSAIIRSGSIIYCGSRIGHHLETGHNVIIREENKLGDEVRIWSNSIIDYGCTVENRVRIHCNVYIAQFTVIGEDSFLAPGVTIANDPHPVCAECMKGPVIGSRVRIGVNCSILPRVQIGDDSLIGAGAVVTRDIPSGSVAVGNPARVVGRTADLKCHFGKKGLAYPYLSVQDHGQ